MLLLCQLYYGQKSLVLNFLLLNSELSLKGWILIGLLLSNLYGLKYSSYGVSIEWKRKIFWPKITKVKGVTSPFIKHKLNIFMNDIDWFYLISFRLQIKNAFPGFCWVCGDCLAFLDVSFDEREQESTI